MKQSTLTCEAKNTCRPTRNDRQRKTKEANKILLTFVDLICTENVQSQKGLATEKSILCVNLILSKF